MFVDWAFKTSFVKATHNVGELTQKTVYKNDNLSNYQDYINEVKPYRTKISQARRSISADFYRQGRGGNAGTFRFTFAAGLSRYVDFHFPQFLPKSFAAAWAGYWLANRF